MYPRVALFKNSYDEPVKVRHLATGQVRDISRETLKANQDKYETIHWKFVEPTPEAILGAMLRASTVSWVRPDLDREWEEIRRCGQEEGVDPKQIQEAGKTADIVELDDDTWADLQGSESYGITGIAEAIHYARLFDKNIKSILEGIGGDMAAPLVMERAGKVVLVGGNTRLMVFRALGIQPWVLFIKMP